MTIVNSIGANCHSGDGISADDRSALSAGLKQAEKRTARLSPAVRVSGEALGEGSDTWCRASCFPDREAYRLDACQFGAGSLSAGESPHRSPSWGRSPDRQKHWKVDDRQGRCA